MYRACGATRQNSFNYQSELPMGKFTYFNKALLYIIQRSVTPTENCTEDKEGEIDYNPVDPSTIIWLCNNLTWKPYQYVELT